MHDFVEPPKISNSHKKKTERERERERLERENAQRAADYYRKKQEETNRPLDPREPLKRTADNNWVHVTCAVWTPEIKFGNAKALGPSEGIPLIPRAKYAEVCKVCRRDEGACVQCHHCHTPVHIECAHQAGYVLGFDMTPVKGSRRDQTRIVTLNGETGAMSASVWCKDHLPTKTTVHRMHETVAETGANALQLYVQNYKQADLTLTGCARKANQITVASKMTPFPTSTAIHQNRRASLAIMMNGDHDGATPSALQPGGKICLTCGVDVSPKWHAIDQAHERELTNGYYGTIGSEAQKFVDQRSFQCHKCKKAGRQPVFHSQPPPREPTPPPEPARQAVSQVAPATVLPAVRPDEPRLPSRAPSYGWPPAPGPSPSVQAPLLQAPAPPLPIAMPIAPPPVQALPVAPPPLPPTLAPRAPPVQPPPPRYASPRPFDWHRPSTGHGPPPLHASREINGGPSPPPPSMSALAPPNHLRPSPIGIPQHPAAQSPPNGHMVPPPFVNGIPHPHPQSPRRVSGPPPPPPNGGPYHPHHGHPATELRPHHMPPMNAMPPVGMGHSGPEAPPPPPNYLRQWGHHQGHQQHPHHHGSPPPPMGHHEQQGMPLQHPSAPPPPPQHREGRPASGASASPSLRNLLS